MYLCIAICCDWMTVTYLHSFTAYYKKHSAIIKINVGFM